MLSYIEHDPSVARRVFELSQSAQEPAGAAAQSIAERNARSAQDTSWPFMCVAIMFTKEALQCLRRGVLNDKCNKRKTVFGVINEFHRACFAEFERYACSRSFENIHLLNCGAQIITLMGFLFTYSLCTAAQFAASAAYSSSRRAPRRAAQVVRRQPAQADEEVERGGAHGGHGSRTHTSTSWFHGGHGGHRLRVPFRQLGERAGESRG